MVRTPITARPTTHPAVPSLSLGRRLRSSVIVGLQRYAHRVAADVAPLPDGSLARAAGRGRTR